MTAIFFAERLLGRYIGITAMGTNPWSLSSFRMEALELSEF